MTQRSILGEDRLQASSVSGEGKQEGLTSEVIDDCRHLRRLCFWSTHAGCHGSGHTVPINLSINNH